MPRRSTPRRTRRFLVSLVAAAGLAALAVAVALALGGSAPRAPGAGGRIPPPAYEAYLAASAAAPEIAPGCAVDWTILAGIGQVESKHGRPDDAHRIGTDGLVTPPIRGPRLDGRGGTRPIPDTDAGVLDGDLEWDRAVGPLQFIPTTWAELGRDGSGDGVADPDNLYDAALTAAAHLCLREPGDYADRSQLRPALVAYNASGRYAEQVLEWVDWYRERPLGDVLATPSPGA